MLDLQMLESMPPKTMFATGYAVDEIGSLFIWGTGEKLKWVAVRGEVSDWAVYCCTVEGSSFNIPDIQYIAAHGDKVTGEVNIKHLVPCTDEAFERYRY